MARMVIVPGVGAAMSARMRVRGVLAVVMVSVVMVSVVMITVVVGRVVCVQEFSSFMRTAFIGRDRTSYK